MTESLRQEFWLCVAEPRAECLAVYPTDFDELWFPFMESGFRKRLGLSFLGIVHVR